ncbi:hypothetical protein ColLi_07640 [Colletotrichum liriopes]|uniref:Uncharacterized protein n=1 Tax=Colletotrichum liriopes TaxID=708192 RepID=A0AA37GPY4_9PEZI|nr:hypothetical protein ColLi_07640 [Colletotrichum liriopes]
MPFFGGGRREPSPEPVREPTPPPRNPAATASSARAATPPRNPLFGSRRDPSPTPTTRTSATSRSSLSSTTYHTSPDGHHNGTGTGGGVFRRSTDASSGRRGILHKFGGAGGAVEMDPSIVQARERVMGAEAAEKEADRALLAARESVAAARAEVRRLEEEAREEARRAKIKQYHAREVSKRGKALGRTYYPTTLGMHLTLTLPQAMATKHLYTTVHIR